MQMHTLTHTHTHMEHAAKERHNCQGESYRRDDGVDLLHADAEDARQESFEGRARLYHNQLQQLEEPAGTL